MENYRIFWIFSRLEKWCWHLEKVGLAQGGADHTRDINYHKSLHGYGSVDAVNCVTFSNWLCFEGQRKFTTEAIFYMYKVSWLISCLTRLSHCLLSTLSKDFSIFSTNDIIWLRASSSYFSLCGQRDGHSENIMSLHLGNRIITFSMRRVKRNNKAVWRDSTDMIG